VSDVQAQKTVTLNVLRTNPARSVRPHYQVYQIPLEPGMTVLSALLYAKERLDHSLAIRFSCRMASCGMKINGLPRLACYTQAKDLGDEPITVEPLEHYPVVRDLVTNFHCFFAKHESIRPYLMRHDIAQQESSESEYYQSPRELENFLQFSYCIKCGLCNAACPTLASDANFIGPQALGQAYRYLADSRDQGSSDRLRIVDHEHGIWRCHFAGSCSYVCPKGVDPALGIQRLRRLVIFKPVAGRKAAPLLPKHAAKSPWQMHAD